MLFEEEHRTALAFQTRACCRTTRPVDGLEVTFRTCPPSRSTRSAGIQTQVGGNWYDIIPLAAGRVGIIIGDVEEHGARAGRRSSASSGRANRRGGGPPHGDPAPGWTTRAARSAHQRRESHGFAAADPPIVELAYLVFVAWRRRY